MEKVFPEIVRTDEDGLKSVEYQLLNAAIVEAIKEQQTTIETLNDKLENQQNQINELNRIINRITKDDWLIFNGSYDPKYHKGILKRGI